MTYTLATHFPTQNYTLLHTGLSAHLHTFTHHPIGVCKVCKCVVWFCVCSPTQELEELFSEEMKQPAWRAAQ